MSAEESSPVSRWLSRAARSPAVVFALLLAALAVRLWAVTQARFDRDEAGIWVIALDMVDGRSFPVIGGKPSGSEGGYPGTLVYALSALAQLFTRDPLAGGVEVALVNVLGLWAFHRAVARGWSPEAALVWLVASVASPGSVTFSDRMWMPNFALPLLAAVVLALVEVTRGRGGAAVVAAGFVLVVSPQFHLSFLHLYILALATLALERPRLPWRPLLRGLLLGVAVYLPYLLHELSTGFDNTRKLLAGAGGSQRLGGPGAVGALVYLFLGQGTCDASYLMVQGWWGGFDPFAFWTVDGVGLTSTFYGKAAPFLWTMQLAGWLLVVVGLGVMVRAALSRDDPARLFGRFMLIALASILGLFALSRRGSFAHYVAFVGALGVLPAAAGVLAALRSRRTALLALAYLLLLPVADLLVLRGHYPNDARLSIPLQKAVVRQVMAATGDEGAFELQTAFPDGKPVTYGMLARGWAGAAWRASDRAREVFTVVPRGVGAAATVPGRIVDVTPMPAGTELVHSRR